MTTRPAQPARPPGALVGPSVVDQPLVDQPLVETPVADRPAAKRPVVEPVETPFTVLVVCTGNICRSPLAEQLLRANFAAAGIFARVHSAGTLAMVGDGMTPEATALSRSYGAAPAPHKSRQLTHALIASADLVLTATREHRSDVVTLHPRASRYTFTLTQFARLVDAAAPVVELGSVVEPVETRSVEPNSVVEPGSVVEPVETTLRTFITEIAATRGLTPPPARPDEDDIQDPYKRSQSVYDHVALRIDTAATTITRGLATATGRA